MGSGSELQWPSIHTENKDERRKASARGDEVHLENELK